MNIKNIVKSAIVEADIILSSGEPSIWYVDLRKIMLAGEYASTVGNALVELTNDIDYEAVGGLTLGADPVALALMYSSPRKIDAFIVRKEKKHGLGKRIEGSSITGRRVLIVEDVSTTGASALEAVSAVQQEGAEVVGIVTIIDRGGKAAIEVAGFKFRSLFSASDLVP